MSDAGTGWTEDRVELLGKLWSDGLSASQIAGILGQGVTRNAVIGKVHRLGLAARAKSSQPAPARSQKPRSPASAAAPAPDRVARTEPQQRPGAAPARTEPSVPADERVAIPVSERVSILELRDSMCRWPIGDPTRADFGFCGGRAVTGLPYCSAHCRIAFQPAAERKRFRA